MSLRGPGLTALSRHTTSAQAYNHLSSQLTAQQLTDLRSQLETFSNALRNFASAHRNDILKDPEFRGEFQRMCANIGVDPLAAQKVSNTRSGGGSGGAGGGKFQALWNDLLGLGDFNYELGVQIVDVCISTRHLNGGVIHIDALLQRLERMRGNDTRLPGFSPTISEEDVLRSIKSLEPLGCGYQVISTSTQPGAPKLLSSLPGELSLDSTLLLSLLALSSCPRLNNTFPYLTEDHVIQQRTDPQCPPLKPKWTRQRARNALHTMAHIDGTLWLDAQGTQPRYFSLASASLY